MRTYGLINMSTKNNVRTNRVASSVGCYILIVDTHVLNTTNKHLKEKRYQSIYKEKGKTGKDTHRMLR